MIHMILTILKILGILLLILLGILLAVILAVLFVPVCYSGWGKKYGKELSGGATVSWLFYLIHGKVVYEGGKTGFEIYLFGIPLRKVKQKLDTRKAAKQGKKVPESKPSPAAQEIENVQNVQKKNTTERKLLQQADIPETHAQNTVSGKKITKENVAEKNTAPAEETTVSREKIKIMEKAAGIWKKIKAASSKVWHFPSECMKKLRKIKLTFQGICDKIKQWHAFIKMNSTKEAIRFLKGKAKQLLHHVLPRKIRGSVTFGFDDPSVTGKLLAAAGMFYPVYKNKFRIIPVFDQVVLEGELKLKGRICCGYLLWIGLQILLNKDVKVTYQRVQRKEA